jgi:hypothetical protein
MEPKPLVAPRIQPRYARRGNDPIKIERRCHPKEKDGWCNLCERTMEQTESMDGVIIEYDRSDAPKFLFFCVECVRTMAKCL